VAPWILIRSQKLVLLHLEEAQQIVVGVLLLLAAMAKLGRGWGRLA
jgi:hypothetical protein